MPAAGRVLGPYYEGQTVTLHFEVRYGGDLTDATSVTLKLTAPDGTTSSTTSVSHDGVGLYSYQWTAGAAPAVRQPNWAFRIDAPLPVAGTPNAVDQGTILVVGDPTA